MARHALGVANRGSTGAIQPCHHGTALPSLQCRSGSAAQ